MRRLSHFENGVNNQLMVTLDMVFESHLRLLATNHSAEKCQRLTHIDMRCSPPDIQKEQTTLSFKYLNIVVTDGVNHQGCSNRIGECCN